jgi:lipid-A-disaccharide synthase
MAKWAKKQGIKVIYYISPQIWAWNQSRAEAIRENVDRMMVILPFEKAFYRSKNIDVDYVGHPLAHRLGTLQKDERFRLKHQLDDKPIIALLPGSRRQEVTKMLGIMLKATTNTKYQYVIAQAPNLEDSFYHSLLIKHAHVRLVKDETYQLLLNAQSAAVTSGTATLETAILGVPQVVCYRSSPISYQLAKRLIKVKYISLVNLIADKNLVPELIQSNLTKEKLEQELEAISTGEKRAYILSGYKRINSILAGTNASESAAHIILDQIAE